MNSKVVTILSGGVDSSTLLYKLANDGHEVYALTFIYGQKHSKEVEAARKIALARGVAHKVVDISGLSDVLAASALINAVIPIPEVPETAEHYDTLKTTIVPNRNAIFLSIAVAYGVSMGANGIFYGAHFSDRGVYPDCRKEFVEAFTSAERLATANSDLSIVAPFVDMTKRDVVALGVRLKVPYELTWSCYKGSQKHCGACSSCRERKRAFQESGVPDPTVYEQ